MNSEKNVKIVFYVLVLKRNVVRCVDDILKLNCVVIKIVDYP